MIEAQFTTQRARLASIMSICTVEGAEESEGLRVAHDRCLSTVKQLLYQERVLEDTLVRSIQSSQRSSSRNPSDRHSHSQSQSQYTGQSLSCGSANTDCYYPRERRPSRVGIAM